MLAPDDVRAIVGAVRGFRPSEQPFDVAVALSDEGDVSKRADMIAEYSDAGVTWWMEGILEDAGTLGEMRSLIRDGPRGG